MATLRVTHRWAAIVLGLLLLLVTISGSLLLFKPEAHTIADGSHFRATTSAHPVGGPEALSTVQRARPTFGATSVGWSHGVWEVPNGDYRASSAWIRAPAASSERKEIGVIGFLDNLHECALSCEGLPGYIKQLNDRCPTWLYKRGKRKAARRAKRERALTMT